MDSSNFLKVLEYLLLHHAEKNLETDQIQNGYRNAAGRLERTVGTMTLNIEKAPVYHLLASMFTWSIATFWLSIF